MEREELLTGLKQVFNVYFSAAEVTQLMLYLDADNSGDIDYQEFI